jgi:hypothetical protein
MSESQPIQLETIEGSLVSKDGRHVLVKCRTAEGGETDIVIPTTALDNLIKNLQLLTTSAEIVMHTSDPIRVPTVTFDEPEPTFYVTALGGTVRPETGLIQLRIGEIQGRVFQLSMMKEQSQVLYNLLLDVFASGDEAAN